MRGNGTFFRCKQDDIALDILSDRIKDRPVIGIDATEIILGSGSCIALSQQETDKIQDKLLTHLTLLKREFNLCRPVKMTAC